ncbi:MAG: adenylate/guanylate cyclase domain-containing protein [Acidimicrobiia bacterium]
MNPELAQFLLDHGATPEEIARAEAEGWLTLLTIDRSLFAQQAKYSREEVAQNSGVDPEVSVRLWRALGFPDVPEGAPVFTEESIDVLTTLQQRVEAWFMRRNYSPDDAVEALVQQVRALSGGFARVAEVLSDNVIDSIDAAHEAGLDDEMTALFYVENLEWSSLAELFDYVLRLQMRDAVWRKLAIDDATATRPTLAVGFLDLVGFTAISQLLDDEEIGALVTRFEALTHDTIAELGGRLVKTIGDEVMFVSETPEITAKIALRLTERTGDDAVLPDARAGLTYGSVVAREGDYYGPVVNLAHRLVEVAYPGTILASGPLHDAIAHDPFFSWGRPRDRKIRDIGRIGTWPLRGGDHEAAR